MMPENFRVERVVLDSLWLAWSVPERLDNICGYEIFINGYNIYIRKVKIYFSTK